MINIRSQVVSLERRNRTLVLTESEVGICLAGIIQCNFRLTDEAYFDLKTHYLVRSRKSQISLHHWSTL